MFFIRYNDNINTICSNEEEVRSNYKTTLIAFYRPAVRSTEMLIIDPDNFGMSALRITAQHYQVTVPLKLQTLLKKHSNFDVLTKKSVKLIHKISIV